MQILHFNQNYY